MSQHIQGPFGPLVLTFCGLSPKFEGNWPKGARYFDPCKNATHLSQLITTKLPTQKTDQPVCPGLVSAGGVKCGWVTEILPKWPDFIHFFFFEFAETPKALAGHGTVASALAYNIQYMHVLRFDL